jgi:hypothetical protein
MQRVRIRAHGLPQMARGRGRDRARISSIGSSRVAVTAGAGWRSRSTVAGSPSRVPAITLRSSGRRRPGRADPKQPRGPTYRLACCDHPASAEAATTAPCRRVGQRACLVSAHLCRRSRRGDGDRRAQLRPPRSPSVAPRRRARRSSSSSSSFSRRALPADGTRAHARARSRHGCARSSDPTRRRRRRK